MRILSWVLSLFLHAGVVYAGAYLAVPKTIHVSLDRPVYQVDLVRLAPARKAGPKPRPVVLAKPAPVPAPASEAVEISPAEKKAPEKEPVPEKPAKPKLDRKRVLAEALTHAQKDVAWLKRMDRKALENELSGLRESVAEEDSALGLPGAGTGNATGGASSEDGLIAIYAKLVEMAVKENWRFPRLHSERVLVAKVEIHVNPDGGILDYKLLVSSGRPDFDASALKAVDETKQLPIPPRPDLSVLRINFNLQELE